MARTPPNTSVIALALLLMLPVAVRAADADGAVTGTGRATVTRLPQVLLNVAGVDKAGVRTDEAVTEAVAAAERELGRTGRVLLRASGTEPLVRVMVEAPDIEGAERHARAIADVVRSRLTLA